jgi:uncharacterized glyoxalase superfamily protein PhnB
MKLATIGVAAKDLKKSVEFYELLGFEFEELKDGIEHIEAVNNGIRFMIDSYSMLENVLGEKPIHSNHAHFSLEFENKDEVNRVVDKLKKEGHKIKLEPFEAFWGQYYSTIIDPDGNFVDLYCWMK